MIPPIEIPFWITKSFIIAHPELTFIYSNDGTYSHSNPQSKHGKGLFNAIPLPTKFRDPCDREDSYFSDSKMFLIEALWLRVFRVASSYNKPVICFPKMGTGRADLPNRAPECYKLLQNLIATYQHPNIKWI